MITNIHSRDGSNVGDINCGPVDYYHIPGMVGADIHRAKPPGIVVIGGGGLLANTYFDDKLDAIRRNASKIIYWGVGHNRHGQHEIKEKDYPRDAVLAGFRDFPSPQFAEWVPCVSCKHPAFGESHEITREFVLFSNTQFDIRLDGIQCSCNNTHIIGGIPDVLRFLGSAETVLTNSYHGAYWATLLGRKVVAFPFSSKFYGFRHPPVLCQMVDWREAVKRAVRYDGALEECRQANDAFADRVMSTISE